MLRNGYTLHSSLCLVSPSPIDCVVQFRCVQSDLSLRVGTRLFSVRPRSASTRFRLSRMGLSPHPSFLMWSIDCPGVQSLSPSPFLNDCPHHHLLGCVPGLTWHPIVGSPPHSRHIPIPMFENRAQARLCCPSGVPLPPIPPVSAYVM